MTISDSVVVMLVLSLSPKTIVPSCAGQHCVDLKDLDQSCPCPISVSGNLDQSTCPRALQPTTVLTLYRCWHDPLIIL